MSEAMTAMSRYRYFFSLTSFRIWSATNLTSARAFGAEIILTESSFFILGFWGLKMVRSMWASGSELANLTGSFRITGLSSFSLDFFIISKSCA